MPPVAGGFPGLKVALRLGSCCSKQIEKCKLKIREVLKECEEVGGARPIPATNFDDNGELDEKHIFCSQCLEPESYEVRTAGAMTTALPLISPAYGSRAHAACVYDVLGTWARQAGQGDWPDVRTQYRGF